MPRFEPFAGLQYALDRVRLDDVIAPPYDVISPEDQAALEARSAYNAVRVELPGEGPGVDRYQAAAHRLTEWQAGGILRPDDEPALYGYCMDFDDGGGQHRRTVGVIGALGLDQPGQKSILPHEHTTPKAKSDRLQLLRATRANLSPIWCLSPTTGLSDLLSVPTATRQATDTDGVTHRLWAITQPVQLTAIARMVARGSVILADGHHRYETALTYQRERRQANAGQAGAYDLVMSLIVELADEQLSVQAVHRLINVLPDGFDLPGALSTAFDLMPTDAPDATIADRMLDAGALALVTPVGSWLLRPKPATVAAAGSDLDASRLDVALATLPAHEVSYQHGWDLATAAVTGGKAQAVVLLRPATIDQIAATGRGGDRMPPKTTFFWPKPRTGLVFRAVPG